MFFRFLHRWGSYSILAVAHLNFVTGMSEHNTNKMYLIMMHFGGSAILLGSLEYYKRLGVKNVSFKYI
jgi:hypothetical protein